MTHSRVKVRRGFTLVELLVVISIVALLISLLLPALSRAREISQRVACATVMKQIAIGTTAYRLDYRDWLPCINNAGHGGVMWGLTVPSAYKSVLEDYWPADVRSCPTLGKMSTENFRWMYAAPMLGNEYAAWGWMGDRTTSDFAYVRVVPGAAGYYSSPGVFTKYGPPFWYYGYDPTKSHPLFADLLGLTLGYRTTPHGGSSSDPFVNGNVYNIDSAGANSLWEDMHVEWHDWPKSAANFVDPAPGYFRPHFDPLATGVEYYPHHRASGYGTLQGDGWNAAGNTSANYFFWLKEAKVFF